MPVIDERGRVFGLVNVVDLLAILLVIVLSFGVVVAFVGVPPSIYSESTQPVTVVVESVERPYIEFALAGAMADNCGDAAAIENVAVMDEWHNATERVDYERLRVAMVVNASRGGDGVWRYDGQVLHVGDQFTLDGCTVRFDATIISVREVS